VTGVGLFGGTCTTGPCVYSLTCSVHSHEGAGVSLTQHALSAAYAGRRRALRALGRITGTVGVEAVLDEVFGSFCIGK
jgi:tRNA modification GTPase